jgi:hypothetical protein
MTARLKPKKPGRKHGSALPRTVGLEFHPLADIFPLMEGEAFEDFKADIKARGGILEPIITLDGKILDGRNRWRASKAARIPIPDSVNKPYNARALGPPLAWVISKNLKRRHLNESQRSWVAAKVANLEQGQHQDRVEGSIDLSTASRMLNVSEKSIKRAKTVQRDAEPELQAAAEQCRISVSLAALASKLSKEEQPDIAQRAIEDDARIVRKVTKRHLRNKRERDLGAALQKAGPLPDQKYGVIVEDPEWKFKTFSEDGKGSTAAENHYPTSELEVIKARDVDSIAADDCVCFLWATASMLDQASDQGQGLQVHHHRHVGQGNGRHRLLVH